MRLSTLLGHLPFPKKIRSSSIMKKILFTYFVSAPVFMVKIFNRKTHKNAQVWAFFFMYKFFILFYSVYYVYQMMFIFVWIYIMPGKLRHFLTFISSGSWEISHICIATLFWEEDKNEKGLLFYYTHILCRYMVSVYKVSNKTETNLIDLKRMK